MRALLCMAAVGLSACATGYTYLPQQNATAQMSGQPAADYAIPPEAPQGDVRVASFGITRLDVNAGESVRAMHIRMIVTNTSAVPWTVDTRNQVGAIAGEGQSRPMFASADIGTLPVVQIPAGVARTIDLFYPLPLGMQKARHLPEFDLLWKVDTGAGRVVAERTQFDRVEVAPEYPEAYAYAYGPGWWAPYWWYDPLYFGATFVHPIVIRRPPVIVGRPVVVGRAGPVIVRRPPVRVAPPAHPIASRPLIRR